MSAKWQPISTAPKDGTSILTFEADDSTEGIMRVSRWRNDTIPCGWTRTENAPSHWLPLPLPPKMPKVLSTEILAAAAEV